MQQERAEVEPGRVEKLAKVLGRLAPEGRANLRFHALVGTGVCVGPDAGYWFKDGKACPTILACSREVPEGEATGDEWRARTARDPWKTLVSLLREMTEDEAREAMLSAAP
jgi:hypothetical protein